MAQVAPGTGYEASGWLQVTPGMGQRDPGKAQMALRMDQDGSSMA